MKPSLGRIVLFRSEPSNQASEHPAVINRVWSDECVNLTSFPDCGVPMNKSSVVQNESLTEGDQTYAWLAAARGLTAIRRMPRGSTR